MMEQSLFRLNGCTTTPESYKDADAVTNMLMYTWVASNHWSSTEYNANNACNVNFSNANVNNNNNKNNSFVVRPTAALSEREKREWLESYDDCCRHKMKSDGCVRYSLIMEYDLWDLAVSVKYGTYYPSTPIAFCVTRPKLREIFAANFRDRIVHHWLMAKLNPLFEQRFVEQGNVSFNCRKGFGTLKAVQTLQRHIREVSCDYTSNDCYIGRFDFVGFFMSTDQGVLIEQLRGFVFDNYHGDDAQTVFATLCIVIRHNPSADCIKKGNISLFEQLPPHKTFFGRPCGKGMPIGNLTSQILLNFYMSFFDAKMVVFCTARGGRYIRFVDDFSVVMKSVKDVVEAYKYASKIAAEMLLIELHKDKVYIQHYTKGVKFIGYVLKRDRIYLSNRTFGGLENAMRRIDYVLRNTNGSLTLYDMYILQRSSLSINSYLGFARHVNGYNKKRYILTKYPRVYKYAYLKGKDLVFKVRNKYKFNQQLWRATDEETIRKSAKRLRNLEGRRKTSTYGKLPDRRKARGGEGLLGVSQCETSSGGFRVWKYCICND